MVLSLKAWKSRSLPGLPRTELPSHDATILRDGRQRWRPSAFQKAAAVPPRRLFFVRECRVMPSGVAHPDQAEGALQPVLCQIGVAPLGSSWHDRPLALEQ